LQFFSVPQRKHVIVVVTLPCPEEGGFLRDRLGIKIGLGQCEATNGYIGYFAVMPLLELTTGGLHVMAFFRPKRRELGRSVFAVPLSSELSDLTRFSARDRGWARGPIAMDGVGECADARPRQ
jgi:hypothetical protein